MYNTRNQFTQQALLKQAKEVFDKSKSDNNFYKISNSDCLMSCLAVFSLKSPSLLQFDNSHKNDIVLKNNLKVLYNIADIPSDTQMRDRLDGLPLRLVSDVMKSLIATIQRSKELEKWKFLNKYYLVSLDGTQFFSSKEVHCPCCCEKVYNRGTDKEYKNYHHQMVVGSIVHPKMRQVLPIGFEPIVKSDGDKKNDCERNASKRWLTNFRRDHPQLSTIIIGDGLSSNGPFIKNLEEHRCKYILVAKDDDHKSLMEHFWAGKSPDIVEHSETVDGIKKSYRYMENVPLNDSHPDILVTVVYYEQIDKKGVRRKWVWVTNLEVNKQNFRDIVEGGRCRWKIENETFNTLKNQGYNFEHNYGHGKKTLSNLMAGMMLLAFFIDQILEAFNVRFQFVLNKYNSKKVTWEHLRMMFRLFRISTWDALYGAFLDPPVTDI